MKSLLGTGYSLAHNAIALQWFVMTKATDVALYVPKKAIIGSFKVVNKLTTTRNETPTSEGSKEMDLDTDGSVSTSVSRRPSVLSSNNRPEWEIKYEDLNSRFHTLEGHIGQYREMLSKRDEEIANKNLIIEKLSSRMDALETTLSNKSDSLDDLIKGKEVFALETSTLQTKVAELEAGGLKTLQSDISKMAESLDELALKLTDVEEQEDNMRESVLVLKNDSLTEAGRTNSLRGDIASMEKRLEGIDFTLKEEIREQNRQFQRLSTSIGELAATIKKNEKKQNDKEEEEKRKALNQSTGDQTNIATVAPAKQGTLNLVRDLIFIFMFVALILFPTIYFAHVEHLL